MLCHEGELRSPQLSQSRLQVLMLGEAPGEHWEGPPQKKNESLESSIKKSAAGDDLFFHNFVAMFTVYL